jgi:ankyrin repeat protein
VRAAALVLPLALLAAGCADPEAGPGPTTPSPSVSADAQPTGTTTPTPAPTATATPTPSPAPVAARDPALDLPLIEAAAVGDEARVRQLLAQGASVRATDEQGRTPLVAAAYGNHVAVAAVLVQAGAEVNEKDSTVQSPYLIATSEVGDDPALLDLLLANGADVSSRDSFNGTGLIRAADRGFPVIVGRLLAAGVEVDHVNRLGWTALHEAVILGDGSAPYVEVVRLLVAAGADVNLPSARDGVRPLTHATTRGYTEIAALLQAAGAVP